MTVMASPWFSRLGLVLACSILTACAYAPGITMSSAGGGEAASGSGVPLPQWLRAYEPVPDGQGGYAAGGKPATGVLFPITPDLIRMQRAQLATEVGLEVKRLFGVPKPYTIGPGDVLNIVVWDHPELTLAAAASNSTTDAASLSSVGNGYNVSTDGFVQFPYAGNIKLAGLTESQACEALVTKLGKYIKNPQMTLRVQAYRSGRVYVEGEVRQPGVQSVNDIPLTLPEAIGRAGGFSETADRSTVSITRAGSTTQVNFPQLAKLGVNPSSILLAGGDMVRVLSRDESKVFVLGEVFKPTAMPLRNGQLTLSEALGESGGVSQLSGDPRQIFVLRNGAAGNAEVYHLDARTPAAYALAEGFDLKARDVVFVDPTSLVRFNRVLSLLLPSAQTANATSGIGK
ncbi:polysaccharide biosynthesis/export family protein [Polaromonas jejuensis]|uniref:Polysaccharide biosynthesis/export family protein n=1 Tax=Polaromonas jejuensis TaxID=457502 RepID=A0ABW0Q7F1_9BURK|nr:polysaccharide biosynthesis/export family protein [Polaromonas jejuensis]